MIVKNVAAKSEKLARIVLGAVLVIWGLFLSGPWKPASIVVGVFLIVTAFVGY